MKKIYPFFIATIVSIMLFSCRKEESNVIPPPNESLSSDSLYFSCTVGGRNLELHSLNGLGSFSQRLSKLQGANQDSFIIANYLEFENGNIRIGFSKKLLADTSTALFHYFVEPHLEIKRQVLEQSEKQIPEILRYQEGFFVEYTGTKRSDSIGDSRKWTSYLKMDNDDTLLTTVDQFQNNSSCSITKSVQVSDALVYIEATFNCTLYDVGTGDTLRLTGGILKAKF